MPMKSNLLEIKNLFVSFKTPDGKDFEAVKGISLGVGKGEIAALVGESGSGKSVSALSILKLLPYPAAFHPRGEIFFEGEDILKWSERKLRNIRGNKISMIFQEPMTSLNPLHTIGKQISEAILLHHPMSRAKAELRVKDLLGLVGLEVLASRLSAYPHELSGGQRQRIMIAMALANEPELLIADEPTTALDVTIQAQILNLIRDIQKKNGMSVLLITHDLTIVENIADKVAVMKNGEIVEQGAVSGIFSNPEHKYTKHLLSSAPKGKPVAANFDAENMIEASGLKVHFALQKSFFGKALKTLKAVDDIDVAVRKGHTLGVVGESGSGKTTIALAMLRLIKSEGKIVFCGKNIDKYKNKELRPLRKKMQIVFQDPFSSLNPRMSVFQVISEGLLEHRKDISKEELNHQVDKAMADVGLPLEYKKRYPHEFSGGQRQRIGIARAIILKPELIALDEPTSALDLSTQSEILDILKKLQQEYGLTYIFISHDLRVIKSIAHDLIVLRSGQIVESGSNQKIFNAPEGDYTKSLMKAAFSIK